MQAAQYAVAVSWHGSDPATLLALASALHRRGVDVLDARLSQPVAGRRAFEATILATPRQADTVEATLRGLVPVAEARVVPEVALAAVPAGAQL